MFCLHIYFSYVKILCSYLFLMQSGSDGEQITCRVHWGVGGGGKLDQGEGRCVDRVRPDIGRGGPQAPAVSIFSTAEVNPTGVGIRAAGHPGN